MVKLLVLGKDSLLFSEGFFFCVCVWHPLLLWAVPYFRSQTFEKRGVSAS